ncbi:hypothetical protein BD309DRAFT_577787 [Dichomitus squalens]|nr:hypothetical protein BD309DRAFT_577787 [Dichomitus squalens]
MSTCEQRRTPTQFQRTMSIHISMTYAVAQYHFYRADLGSYSRASDTSAVYQPLASSFGSWEQEGTIGESSLVTQPVSHPRRHSVSHQGRVYKNHPLPHFLPYYIPPPSHPPISLEASLSFPNTSCLTPLFSPMLMKTLFVPLLTFISSSSFTSIQSETFSVARAKVSTASKDVTRGTRRIQVPSLRTATSESRSAHGEKSLKMQVASR